MRNFIDISQKLSEAASDPRAQVREVLAHYMAEHGQTPEVINDGGCFDFADDMHRHSADFQAISLGEIFTYDKDANGYPTDEIGFDEELLAKYWPSYQPLHGFTFEEMFLNGFGWGGIHCWAHHHPTGLVFDAETPDGITNPFELSYFAPRWQHMLELRNQGKLRTAK